ncbi:MAG: prepilin-type N-terminal cleavage/methylation domain-containing protein [Planctomycetes bacterium]|nr:prepilin-type N-terminal cleavage/methylation domain-containing protein [Planctomycetota bacterium]
MSRSCLKLATAPSRRNTTTVHGCRRTRQGFSLVELMVVVTIMALLVGLISAAVAGARSSSRKQQTQLLISKLDTIIRQQFASYASKTAPTPASLPAGFSRAAYRSWYIRRNLISGDLPDNWTDVASLASGSSVGFGTSQAFPLTATQTAYANLYRGISSTVTPTWGDAECLFMIVTQGGIANCIDCGDLKTAERGDKDLDGAFEFWDAWGNPIGFVLWPAGLQLPAGAGSAFYSGARQLEDPQPSTPGVYPSPSLGMRPLIYSAGPDGVASIGVSAGNLSLGLDCGNPTSSTVQKLAGFLSDPSTPGDYRADNITNLDAEAAK